MRDMWTTLGLSAVIGVISGMRSFSGLAFVSRGLSKNSRAARPRGAFAAVLGSSKISGTLSALAVGEMAADKSSAIPDRTETMPLIGRAVFGALAAITAADYRRSRKTTAALVAASAAVASTYAFYNLRKEAGERLNIPDWAVALTEDGIVVAGGWMIAELMANADS